MADSTPPRKPTPADSAKVKSRASVERATALRDVMSHAVEVEKDARRKSGPPKGGSFRGVMLVFSLMLLAFTSYAYAAKPEFIFGADPNKIPEVRRDANVRFTLYLLSRRVESYKKTGNRLPTSLAEIPGAPVGVTYSRLSDSVFELRAKDGAKELVLRSDEPADRFLGQTPRVLSGRGP